MPHYFLKLIPPRPTFSQDMTGDEREIMLQHVAYWTGVLHTGMVVVFGPVLDPAGVYGIGVVEVENEEKLLAFIQNDPAASINKYEHYPMRAVVPPK